LRILTGPAHPEKLTARRRSFPVHASDIVPATTVGRPPDCGWKLIDPEPLSVVKSSVPITPRPPASTSRQRNGYGARSTDSAGLTSIAVAPVKSATSAAFSSLLAAPFLACQPFHAAGPPSTQAPPARSAEEEPPKSLLHSERNRPGLAWAEAAATAGRPAKSAARSRLGLNTSSRASSPAIEPTCKGFDPGRMRPRRAG
jgi:hypothetical protein